MFADAWKPFHASARDGLTPPQHTGQIPPPRQHQSAFLAEGLPAGQTFVPGLPTAPFLTSIFFGFHASAVVKKMFVVPTLPRPARGREFPTPALDRRRIQ